MISVIIPTYNRNKILCETIEQLLKQVFNNFEIIIVDQSENHDDETIQYINSVKDKIRYFHISNPNLPAARNFGIRKSQGELIVFFDDDMIIPHDTLSKLSDAFKHDFINALSGFVLYPDQLEKTKWNEVRKRKNINNRFFEVEDIRGYFMCFRKSVFEAVGYFDEWIGTQPLAAAEDYEFSRRAKVNDIKLFLDSTITLVHLGEKTGGCERRSLTPDTVEKVQMRMFCYAVLKNRKFKNFFGFVLSVFECYRPILRGEKKSNFFNRIFNVNKVISLNLRQIKENKLKIDYNF